MEDSGSHKLDLSSRTHCRNLVCELWGNPATFVPCSIFYVESAMCVWVWVVEHHFICPGVFTFAQALVLVEYKTVKRHINTVLYMLSTCRVGRTNFRKCSAAYNSVNKLAHLSLTRACHLAMFMERRSRIYGLCAQNTYCMHSAMDWLLYSCLLGKTMCTDIMTRPQIIPLE